MTMAAAFAVQESRVPVAPHGFPDTRWSLINRLTSDPDQVGLLVELYADGIARYLDSRFPSERLRGHRDDLLQEVALDLLRKPEVLARARAGEGSRFRYLIMTMAANAARNYLRREERHDRLQPPIASSTTWVGISIEQVSLPQEDERSAMDRAWATSLLTRAFEDVEAWVADGTLDSCSARILREHLVEGRPLREIASDLGLPLTSCHRRLAKVRTYLQATIVDRLRATGEVNGRLDPAEACDLLLSALQG